MLQLIVAVTPEEIPRLEGLLKRGNENGVKDLKMVESNEIKDYEPNCVVGILMIYSLTMSGSPSLLRTSY
jgi:L-2-hydroxyglutarate oxidase LhgO